MARAMAIRWRSPPERWETGAADNRIIAIIQLVDTGRRAALFGCRLHLCVCGTGSLPCGYSPGYCG